MRNKILINGKSIGFFSNASLKSLLFCIVCKRIIIVECWTSFCFGQSTQLQDRWSIRTCQEDESDLYVYRHCLIGRANTQLHAFIQDPLLFKQPPPLIYNCYCLSMLVFFIALSYIFASVLLQQPIEKKQIDYYNQLIQLKKLIYQ